MNSVQPSPSRGKHLPLILMVVSSLMLAGGIFWFSQSPRSVSANIPDITLAENTYPNIKGSSIDTCVLCHTSSIPNLNPYGSAYKAGGRDKATSLTSIENADSDGDGFTNITELKALTFPGDPASHPAAAATATTVPPTATKVPPTATNVPPTATKVPPTSTTAPTATGVAIQGPTATKASTAITRPTSTKMATATKAPVMVGATARPTQRVSPTPTCIRDSQPTSKSSESEKDDDHEGRRGRCPKGSHEDPWELEKETISSMLRGIFTLPKYSKNH